MPPLPFTLSLVLEFENGARIGLARARRMLRVLHQQLCEADRDLVGSAEIICVFDPEEVPEAAIRSLIEDAGEWPCPLIMLASSGSYYAQKNAGAEVATHDLVIFLDSDVIPEPGWLEALVRAFRSPDAEIVGGTTFVGAESLYTAAMALGWIFPLRPQAFRPVRSRGFFANNVAFRRVLQRDMQFPESNQYRGQGPLLFEALSGAGRTIIIDPAAAVSHPAPEPSQFAFRALWSGYDALSGARLSRHVSIPEALGRVLVDSASALLRVKRGYRQIELNRSQAILASAVVAAYHALRVVGFLIAYPAPRWLHRNLSKVAP